MNKENGVVEEATSSNSSGTAVQEQEKKKHKKGEREGEDVGANKVPFYKLFAFADATDKALMIIGSIGAVGNGVCMPLMTILLGDLIDAFGQNQNDRKNVIHVISQVCLINVKLTHFFLCFVLICIAEIVDCHTL